MFIAKTFCRRVSIYSLTLIGLTPFLFSSCSSGPSSSTQNGTAGPTITSVSPSSGSVSGGTQVYIMGTDFQTGATVTFGGSSATNVNIISATEMSVVTPAGIDGATTIVIYNPDGSSISSSNFTYSGGSNNNVYPTISMISPTTGSISGGTLVTITGANFASGATVLIGNSTCGNVSLIDSTDLTCTTSAASAGTYTVTVDNPGGLTGSLTSAFTYSSSASNTVTISSINPTSGPLAGGDSITIYGTGFESGAEVYMGASLCSSPSVVGSTMITCTVPANSSASAVDVAVLNTDGTSSIGSVVTYTYTTSTSATPQITALSTNTGGAAGGTSLTIYGLNFQSGAIPTFDGVAATNVNVTDTSITCDTPAHAAGSSVLEVISPTGQSSNSETFTFVNAAPTISSISPNWGYTTGGTGVTITGTNFLSDAKVYFGAIAATSVQVVNSTTINCLTPASTEEGQVSVSVINSDTQGASAGGLFNYVAPPQVCSTFNANGGGSQILYSNQGVTLNWTSTNATTCTVYTAYNTVLAQSLKGSTGVPILDSFNDDTYYLNCVNANNQRSISSLTINRKFYAVGGPAHASYRLGSLSDAQACASRIALGGPACATNVKIGATRDGVNQSGVTFDSPNSCHCGATANYAWY